MDQFGTGGNHGEVSGSGAESSVLEAATEMGFIAPRTPVGIDEPVPGVVRRGTTRRGR